MLVTAAGPPDSTSVLLDLRSLGVIVPGVMSAEEWAEVGWMGEASGGSGSEKT